MTHSNKSSFTSTDDTYPLISSITRRHSVDSTHLIPSPAQDKPFKRYEPLLTKFVVIISVPVLMFVLGLGLEIAIFISDRNGGFKVPQMNVFKGVSPDFLASFFPTLVVLPFAIAWRELDQYLRRYQPYLVLNKGNAKAEESLLLDYIALGLPLTLFRALNYKHRVIFWSSLTAILTYIYQPLAGSTLHVQQRPRTSDVLVTSTKTIGLSTDIFDLKAFVAAAGYVDSSVLLNLSDPQFVYNGWATATFDFPPDQYLNGSLTIETSGIQTNVNCVNPSESPILTPVGTTNFNLSSKSVDGCVLSLLINSTVATNQYGVRDVACPGNVSTLDSSLRPVVFWFFLAQDNNNNTPEARTVFCAPTIQAFNIQAVANLNTGSLTTVSATGNFLAQNNVTSAGGALNGSAFNGLIFNNLTNPYTKDLAAATRSLVLTAIFHSAEQLPNGPQSAFDLPNGFLDITTTLYTRYLSISALSIYFLAEHTNTTLPATIISLIPSLKFAPLPAHILAITLILTGFIGIFLQIISWRKRKQLLLAAPPGSIASAIALTSRSGFGVRLVPYDEELALKEKLNGLRFRLDKRTGAILAEQIGFRDSE